MCKKWITLFVVIIKRFQRVSSAAGRQRRARSHVSRAGRVVGSRAVWLEWATEGQRSYLYTVSVSHIFATRYSHFEDWKVGVIAFKIERQTHLTLWCKMNTTNWTNRFDCLFYFGWEGCVTFKWFLKGLNFVWRMDSESFKFHKVGGHRELF